MDSLMDEANPVATGLLLYVLIRHIDRWVIPSP